MKRAPYTAYNSDGKRKYLTRAEGKSFLEAARRLPRSQALFCVTLYFTGIRISEALALAPENVDAATESIRVLSLKKRARREFRRIPIPSWLVKGLLELARDSPQSKFWPLSRTTGWRIIKRVMTEAGIEGIHATTKGLRHGFGVRGVLVGLPMNLLQTYFGHASLETTSIYLCVRDDEERTLMRKTWK